MNRARQAWIAMLAGALLLAGAWKLLPGGGPPLFDGNCIADPYRYLVASGPTARAATAASQTLPGTIPNPQTPLTTSEQPPQAQLLLPEGSLDIPSGTAAVTLRIAPVPPPAADPPGGAIDGNVYRFSATGTAGRAIGLAAGQGATVLLRATGSGGAARGIQLFSGGHWTRLATSLAGCADTYEALPPTLGEFAVVRPGSAGGAATSAPATPLAVLEIVAGSIVILLAVVTLIRLGRLRSHR